ncbi:unnamed protein product, partial [Heterotrigona itama]
VDHIKQPLEQPYEGPYRVIKYISDNVFLKQITKANYKGKETTISTERWLNRKMKICVRSAPTDWEDIYCNKCSSIFGSVAENICTSYNSVDGPSSTHASKAHREPAFRKKWSDTCTLAGRIDSRFIVGITRSSTKNNGLESGGGAGVAQRSSVHRHRASPRQEMREKPPPARWALKKMDVDVLMAAAHTAAWEEPPADPACDVDKEAD